MGDENTARLRVEVAYALPERQALVTIEVEEGTTVRQAIERSGLQREFPDLQLRKGNVGIFGRRAELEAAVRDGDRVEIYRPLTADPKQARQERARKRK